MALAAQAVPRGCRVVEAGNSSRPGTRRHSVGDGDHLLGGAERGLGQGRLHGEDAVFAQGGLDGLGVGALGQEELAVVLAVHRLAVRLLLVLGVDLQQNERTRSGGARQFQA